MIKLKSFFLILKINLNYMIITSIFFTLLIYKYISKDKNLINLFHKKNKLLAFFLLTTEGIIYLIYGYLKKDTKCKNLRNFIIFMGVYNILLGISLVLMRLTNFLTYLILFFLTMTLIIVTIVIFSMTYPNLITKINV